MELAEGEAIRDDRFATRVLIRDNMCGIQELASREPTDRAPFVVGSENGAPEHILMEPPLGFHGGIATDSTLHYGVRNMRAWGKKELRGRYSQKHAITVRINRCVGGPQGTIVTWLDTVEVDEGCAELDRPEE